MNVIFPLITWIGLAALTVTAADLRGPYLGQTPPTDQPRVFAPETVCTGIAVRDMAISPDGKEIYFSMTLGNYDMGTILVMRERDGRWSAPEVVPHLDDPTYLNMEPALSADGKQLFFFSTRPLNPGDRTPGKGDIWVMDRRGDGWGEPRNLGAPVNTELGEFFPSLTRDGTLYFSRADKSGRINEIFRSRLRDGRYTEPEKLPPQVNCGASQFNAFIAPDESYIIVPVIGRKDGVGATDYYIVFRRPDDTWSEPLNPGDKINTAGGMEFSPYVSPDGKYFFFMRSAFLPREQFPARLNYAFFQQAARRAENGNPSIWWVGADFISALRAKAVWPPRQ